MPIDKNSISRPISHRFDAEEEKVKQDLRSPRERVVDVIVSRLRLVDNGNRGVDLDHVQAMCEEALVEDDIRLIHASGGWSAFTLANTDGKRLRSFREGTRTIIVPREPLDMQELRGEVTALISQEQEVSDRQVGKTEQRSRAPSRDVETDTVSTGSLKDVPDVLRPRTEVVEEKRIQNGGARRETSNSRATGEQGRKIRIAPDQGSKNDPEGPTTKIQQPVRLTKQNQEILEALPRVLKRHRAEFYKDVGRQGAVRLLRAMTLLMRFRDVFQGRSYGQIMQRLQEEGDVAKLGGLEQLLEMGVQAGFLQVQTKGGTTGHVATREGARLIMAAPDDEYKFPNGEPNLDLLEQQLWENYQALRPTKDSDRIRHKIVQDLQRHFDRVFPRVGLQLEIFGSSGTGLYFPGSDCDICAYYTTVPPSQTLEIRQLGNSLRRVPWCTNIFTVAFAKIPVVKLVHTASGLPVDVSIENTIAIENTKLIKLYMDLDRRVKPLAFALKVWCKSRAISHPEEGSLSSYSWILMLIHFLQRTAPPVLPNLQAREDTALGEGGGGGGGGGPFTHTYNGRLIDCHYDESPVFQSENTESVGALFLGFFRYFATSFDFERDVVCTQPVLDADSNWSEPNTLTKMDKGGGDWLRKAIAIQDPFIEDRNTGVGCSPVLADWTVDELWRAWRILQGGGSFADIVTFGAP